MSKSRPDTSAKKRALSLLNLGKLPVARKMCQQYCRETPDDPEAWCLLSTINGALGLNEEAEACGQRAIGLAPNYIPAYYNTAVSMLHLHKPDEAIQYFMKVTEKQPNHSIAHYLMGKCYEMQVGMEDNALQSYQRAMSTIPAPPRELFLDLENLLERTGRKDEAHACVERFLETHPGDPMAALRRARMDEIDGNLDAARVRMEGILETRTSLSPTDHAPVLYRLGLILDKLGEYDHAYEAFRKSQEIAAGHSRQYSSGSWYDRINRNRAAATPENIADWKKHASSDGLAAPIFLVGFPRSGTTLLERIISSHPDIVPSSEEALIQGIIAKLNVMSNNRLGYPYNLNELNGEQVSALRREYWNLAHKRCGASPGKKRFLDKLPLNIIDMGLIHRIFPEAHIILALRDPRDVCLSCFMQLFEANEAMANFFDIESTAKFYDATMKLWHHYEEVLDINLIKIRYEDLVVDLDARARELLEFLGLEWDARVLKYHENRKYKIVTPSYHDTCKPIFSRAVSRWKRYEDHINSAIPYLQTHIDKFGYT